MHLQLERWASPVSPLLLVTDDEGTLRALEFADREDRMHRLLRQHYGDYTLQEGAAPISLIRILKAYFAGRVDSLAEVPTATGGTPFQREVWKALRAIPAGATMSYGQLAANLGTAGASRAVGAAMEPIPSALSYPAIASSAPTAASPATPAASPASNGSSITKAASPPPPPARQPPNPSSERMVKSYWRISRLPLGERRVVPEGRQNLAGGVSHRNNVPLNARPGRGGRRMKVRLNGGFPVNNPIPSPLFTSLESCPGRTSEISRGSIPPCGKPPRKPPTNACFPAGPKEIPNVISRSDSAPHVDGIRVAATHLAPWRLGGSSLRSPHHQANRARNSRRSPLVTKVRL